MNKNEPKKCWYFEKIDESSANILHTDVIPSGK